MLLYKYRSADCKSLERLEEILRSSHLRASRYSELNDPLEGHYFYNKDKIPNEVIEEIRFSKNKTRICSLSKTSDNYLVWSHYADGYRGFALGVTVTDHNKPMQVKYLERLPSVGKDTKAKDILMKKLDLWSYEKEYRVLTNQEFVNVEIKQVILGAKMNDVIKSAIKNLVKQASPQVEVTESVPPSQSAFGLEN